MKEEWTRNNKRKRGNKRNKRRKWEQKENKKNGVRTEKWDEEMSVKIHEKNENERRIIGE